MKTAVVSLLLSLGLVGTLLTVLVLTQRTRGTAAPCTACLELAEELASVQQALSALREDTSTLLEEVRGQDLASRAGGYAKSLAAAAVPAAAGEGAEAQAMPAIGSEAIKSSVLLALAEDRALREEERQTEREAARQRAEAKRQELAALGEGPYDKYNLKVNSLGNVLQLSDAQKQAYYETIKQSRDKLKETLKQAMTAQGEATPAPGSGEEGGRGRGRGVWGKMRELQEAAQKEVEQSLASIFTPAQLETYNQLSRSARDIQGRDQVLPPGEAGREEQDRPGGFSGITGGRSGGGGGRGQRGASRGGPQR